MRAAPAARPCALKSPVIALATFAEMSWLFLSCPCHPCMVPIILVNAASLLFWNPAIALSAAFSFPPSPGTHPNASAAPCAIWPRASRNAPDMAHPALAIAIPAAAESIPACFTASRNAAERFHAR